MSTRAALRNRRAAGAAAAAGVAGNEEDDTWTSSSSHDANTTAAVGTTTTAAAAAAGQLQRRWVDDLQQQTSGIASPWKTKLSGAVGEELHLPSLTVLDKSGPLAPVIAPSTTTTTTTTTNSIATPRRNNNTRVARARPKVTFSKTMATASAAALTAQNSLTSRVHKPHNKRRMEPFSEPSSARTVAKRKNTSFAYATTVGDLARASAASIPTKTATTGQNTRAQQSHIPPSSHHPAGQHQGAFHSETAADLVIDARGGTIKTAPPPWWPAADHRNAAATSTAAHSEVLAELIANSFVSKVTAAANAKKKKLASTASEERNASLSVSAAPRKKRTTIWAPSPLPEVQLRQSLTASTARNEALLLGNRSLSLAHKASVSEVKHWQQVVEQLRRQNASLQVHCEDYERIRLEVEVLRRQSNSHNDVEFDRLEEARAVVETRLRDAKEESRIMQHEKRDADMLVDRGERKYKALETERLALVHKFRHTQSEYDRISKKYEKVEADLEETRVQRDAYATTVKDLERRSERLAKDLKHCEAAIIEHERRGREVDRAHARSLAHNKELTRNLAHSSKATTDAKHALDGARLKITELEGSHAKLQQRIDNMDASVKQATSKAKLSDQQVRSITLQRDSLALERDEMATALDLNRAQLALLKKKSQLFDIAIAKERRLVAEVKHLSTSCESLTDRLTKEGNARRLAQQALENSESRMEKLGLDLSASHLLANELREESSKTKERMILLQEELAYAKRDTVEAVKRVEAKYDERWRGFDTKLRAQLALLAETRAQSTSYKRKWMATTKRCAALESERERWIEKSKAFEAHAEELRMSSDQAQDSAASRIRMLEKQLTKLKKSATTNRHSLEDVRKKNEAKLLEMQSDIDHLRTHMSDVEGEKESLARQLATVRRDLNTANASADTYKQKANVRREMLKKLKSDLIEVKESSMKEYERATSEMRTRLKDLETEHAACTSVSEALQSMSLERDSERSRRQQAEQQVEQLLERIRRQQQTNIVSPGSSEGMSQDRTRQAGRGGTVTGSKPASATPSSVSTEVGGSENKSRNNDDNVRQKLELELFNARKDRNEAQALLEERTVELDRIRAEYVAAQERFTALEASQRAAVRDCEAARTAHVVAENELAMANTKREEWKTKMASLRSVITAEFEEEKGDLERSLTAARNEALVSRTSLTLAEEAHAEAVAEMQKHSDACNVQLAFTRDRLAEVEALVSEKDVRIKNLVSSVTSVSKERQALEETIRGILELPKQQQAGAMAFAYSPGYMTNGGGSSSAARESGTKRSVDKAVEQEQPPAGEEQKKEEAKDMDENDTSNVFGSEGARSGVSEEAAAALTALEAERAQCARREEELRSLSEKHAQCSNVIKSLRDSVVELSEAHAGCNIVGEELSGYQLREKRQRTAVLDARHRLVKLRPLLGFGYVFQRSSGGSHGEPAGMRVTDVRSGMPAADAGLQRGDIVVQMGSVFTSDELAFNRAVKQSVKPGSPVSLLVYRPLASSSLAERRAVAVLSGHGPASEVSPSASISRMRVIVLVAGAKGYTSDTLQAVIRLATREDADFDVSLPMTSSSSSSQGGGGSTDPLLLQRACEKVQR